MTAGPVLPGSFVACGASTSCGPLFLICAASTLLAAEPDGNRLTYLDGVDPYYPRLGFARLTTPQWVGEEGVEAVVVLAIDDMRDNAPSMRRTSGPSSTG